MPVYLSERRDPDVDQVLHLYRLNGWSAAEKPEALYLALTNSHTLITAWDDQQLLGLGNAISDGYLVVYFPHLLVHPEYQQRGIGSMIMEKMQEKYRSFHMQMLTADRKSVEFYQKMGFSKAGDTLPMWIYQGDEH